MFYNIQLVYYNFFYTVCSDNYFQSALSFVDFLEFIVGNSI